MRNTTDGKPDKASAKRPMKPVRTVYYTGTLTAFNQVFPPDGMTVDEAVNNNLDVGAYRLWYAHPNWGCIWRYHERSVAAIHDAENIGIAYAVMDGLAPENGNNGRMVTAPYTDVVGVIQCRRVKHALMATRAMNFRSGPLPDAGAGAVVADAPTLLVQLDDGTRRSFAIVQRA